jgi:hypothetical protein
MMMDSTGDRTLLQELRAYPGWTPAADALAGKAESMGRLSEAVDAAHKRAGAGMVGSSNSSVTIKIAGAGVDEAGFLTALEQELRRIVG